MKHAEYNLLLDAKCSWANKLSVTQRSNWSVYLKIFSERKTLELQTSVDWL